MANFPDDEFSRGWPAVVATFATAVFAWGFGSYGHAVYVEQLQRLHGWPTSALGAATTLCFLLSAVLLPWVGWSIARWGERRVLLGGVILLGAGTIGLGLATALWQIFPCEIVMGIGWSFCGLTAISISLSQRFDRKRGLALGLALNGAGVSGFGVAPALMTLSERLGFAAAVPLVVVVCLVIVAPLIWFGLGPHATAPTASLGADMLMAGQESAPPSRAELLRDPQFWSIAAPFALALSGQVGLFIYQVSYLTPLLGVNGTAFAVALTSAVGITARFLLGLVLDRLPQRAVSATAFAAMAGSAAIWLAFPDRPDLLLFGCAVFGVCISNIIVLPTLVVQREFPTRTFGAVLGLSNAISQVAYSLTLVAIGTIRDLAGSYQLPFALCIGISLLASLLIAVPQQRNPQSRAISIH
jgi:predicted MFS family arabinose efflux permease